jgi:hypothetical protein
MNKSAREKEAVLNVFASLVRPLTRVAFEYGISASEISGAVRRTYIQALEARLLDQKRATTDARLAVVAGLAKSDVTALREATRSGAPHSLRATVSLDQVTNLLTVWHTHSGFSGAYGLALELDLVSTPGSPRRSFRELINAACPGADEDALLDELVADVKRIERMGRFLAVIAANFVHNLLRVSPEPIYFERTVVSDEPLTEVGRDRFLVLAAERGQELLTELDTFLTRLASSERIESGKKYGVGVYFFEDQPTDQTADTQPNDVYEERVPPPPATLEEIDVLAGLNRKK